MPTKEEIPKFKYTSIGYLEAKKWLQEIGEWENMRIMGFSTDGYSVVMEANSIWLRINKNKL